MRRRRRKVVAQAVRRARRRDPDEPPWWAPFGLQEAILIVLSALVLAPVVSLFTRN